MMPWLHALVQDSRAELLRPDSAHAVQYLVDTRKIPLSVAADAGVGYLPPHYALTAPADFLTWAKHGYVHDRLIFPLSTADGKYTGIQTRSLSDAVKGERYQTYQLPSTKGIEPVLFGAEHAGPTLHMGERWQVVLVEGPVDALAVRAAGEPCVIASLTGTPTATVRRWLRRWAGAVLALLDMDAAGRRGVEVLAAEPGLLVSAPAYAVKDPGKLWETHPEALRALVARPTGDDLIMYLRGLL